MLELKIYALDIPGHGLSDHIPDGMNYFYHQFMLWAAEWIESTEENDLVLLGHSLGATIFSMAIPLVGGKVKSFISIDSLGPLTSKEEISTQDEGFFGFLMNFKEKVSPLNHSYDSIIQADP